MKGPTTTLARTHTHTHTPMYSICVPIQTQYYKNVCVYIHESARARTRKAH